MSSDDVVRVGTAADRKMVSALVREMRPLVGTRNLEIPVRVRAAYIETMAVIADRLDQPLWSDRDGHPLVKNIPVIGV